jgi:hypothetical protein
MIATVSRAGDMRTVEAVPIQAAGRVILAPGRDGVALVTHAGPLQLSLLNERGRVVVGPVDVSLPGQMVANPIVAWNGRLWAVTWQNSGSRGAHAVAIDAAGLVSPPAALNEHLDQALDLVGTSHGFVASFTTRTGMQSPRVMTTALECRSTPATLRAPERITP